VKKTIEVVSIKFKPFKLFKPLKPPPRVAVEERAVEQFELFERLEP